MGLFGEGPDGDILGSTDVPSSDLLVHSTSGLVHVVLRPRISNRWLKSLLQVIWKVVITVCGSSLVHTQVLDQAKGLGIDHDTDMKKEGAVPS